MGIDWLHVDRLVRGPERTAQEASSGNVPLGAMRTRRMSSRSAVMRKLTEPDWTSIPSRRAWKPVPRSSETSGWDAAAVCADAELNAIAALARAKTRKRLENKHNDDDKQDNDNDERVMTFSAWVSPARRPYFGLPVKWMTIFSRGYGSEALAGIITLRLARSGSVLTKSAPSTDATWAAFHIPISYCLPGPRKVPRSGCFGPLPRTRISRAIPDSRFREGATPAKG